MIDETGSVLLDYYDTNIINPISFEEYWRAIYNPDLPSQARYKPSPNPVNKPLTKTTVSEFKWGTKQDKTHYTILKDKHQWED